MDYVKIYNQLIEMAKNRELCDDTIYEIHHIIPRSLGGSNDDINLVSLTLREHYIAHKLLLYVYPNNKKMIYAYWMMTTKCGNKVKISSREYQRAKELLLEIKLGSKYSDEQKNNVSIGTKKAMRTRDNIIKSISGSLGCRHYYNRETKEEFKWFDGDAPIDETIYCYGRPPISDEQKKKLSELKNISKTYYYIKELDIRYTCYNDYVKSVPSNWEVGWCNNKSMHIRNAIIKAVREFNLVTEYKYDDLIIRRFPNKSKSFKIITPSIYELFYDILIKSKDEDVTIELSNAILNNIDKIKELNQKYLI